MPSLLRVAALALVAGLAAGSAGAIDPFFPTFGNEGIDVIHYDLNLDVSPVTGHLDAEASLLIRAEKRLTSFTLDLAGLVVSRATVQGVPVGFGQGSGKLTIRPRAPIPAGTAFRLVVDYGGTPRTIHDPTVPGDPDRRLGWFRYGRASYVVSEPVGASTFFPANDEPTDKATFTIAVTVPSPYRAIANGTLLSTRTIGTKRRFEWDMPQPMTTWLATVHVNTLSVIGKRTSDGILVRVYSPPGTPQAEIRGHLRAAEMIPYFEQLIGSYPFASYGSALVADPVLDYALETQSLTTFRFGAFDEAYVAHELAHQWFGDSVSVAEWKDLWIAEGGATYFGILWPNRNHPAAFDAAMQDNYNYIVAHRLGPAVIDRPADLFSDSVYFRGAATYYALRQKVGDPTFFKILRTFLSFYRGHNATSADFIDVAASVSGNASVRGLLHAWLYDEAVPPLDGATAPAAGSMPLLRPDVAGLRCGLLRHLGRPAGCS